MSKQGSKVHKAKRFYASPVNDISIRVCPLIVPSMYIYKINLSCIVTRIIRKQADRYTKAYYSTLIIQSKLVSEFPRAVRSQKWSTWINSHLHQPNDHHNSQLNWELISELLRNLEYTFWCLIYATLSLVWHWFIINFMID